MGNIRTRTGGGCWALPPYYTFLLYSQYGRGTVLRPCIDSPKYDSTDYTDVPYLDAVPVLGDDGTLTIFAVNRSLTEELPLEAELRGFGQTSGKEFRVTECVVLSHNDPKATNTEDNPQEVVPHAGKAEIKGNLLTARLAPLSWNVIRIQ